MSYLNTTNHNAAVIVRVKEEEWKKYPLHSISDWLMSGFFSAENFPSSLRGQKLCEQVRELYFDRVRQAERQVYNGELAILDIARFCRIAVENLDKENKFGTRYLRLSFSDSKGAPHKKYAEHFTENCDGVSCGLEFSQITSEHTISIPGLSDPTEPYDIRVHTFIRAIAVFLNGITPDEDQEELFISLVEALKAGQPCHLPVSRHGVHTKVSLLNVLEVTDVSSRSNGTYQRWGLKLNTEKDTRPNRAEGALRAIPPVLSVTFIPADDYRPSQHCSGHHGLLEHAQAFNKFIDLCMAP